MDALDVARCRMVKVTQWLQSGVRTAFFMLDSQWQGRRQDVPVLVGCRDPVENAQHRRRPAGRDVAG
jgi:hypothetical protein